MNLTFLMTKETREHVFVLPGLRRYFSIQIGAGHERGQFWASRLTSTPRTLARCPAVRSAATWVFFAVRVIRFAVGILYHCTERTTYLTLSMKSHLSRVMVSDLCRMHWSGLLCGWMEKNFHGISSGVVLFFAGASESVGPQPLRLHVNCWMRSSQLASLLQNIDAYILS